MNSFLDMRAAGLSIGMDAMDSFREIDRAAAWTPETPLGTELRDHQERVV